MSWFFYAFTAIFLYTASNFLDKFLIDKRIKNPFLISIASGLAAFIAGTFLLITAKNPESFSIQQILILFGAGFSFELAVLQWFKAIEIDDVSIITPLMQFIPVVSVVLAYIFLGEKLTQVQLVGGLLIIIGGFLIALKKISANTFQIRKSTLYALLSVLFYSAPYIAFKSIAITQSFWSSLSYEFLGAGLGVLVFIWYGKLKHYDFFSEIKLMKASTWGIVGINEVLYLTARIFSFYAIFLGSVSLTTIVAGIQPIITFIIGFALSVYFPQIISEDISKKALTIKIIAALLACGGVILINL